MRPRQRLTRAQAYEAGLAFYRRGAWREAEQFFQAVLRAVPQHAGALHHVGAMRSHFGRFGEAVELLRRAASADPGSAGVRNDLGIALAALGERRAALEQYEAAVALDPRSVEANNNLGAELLALERHDEAIALFRRALAIRPDAAQAHNNLGNGLAALGRFEEAIVHYEDALRLSPDFAEAHNNLGFALAGLGRAPEAIAAFERATAVKPDYDGAYRNLARALVAEERHEAAVAHFQTALALAPEDAATENDLGNALATLGRRSEAIGRYRKAVTLNPDFAEAHNNLGNSLAALNQHEEAIAHYHRALALSPALTEVNNNLGSSLEALDRPDEAIACYEAVLADHPENARSHHLRGYALRTLGRLAEARAALEKAVALAPERPEFYRGFVETKRFTVGDPDLAAMERRAAEIEKYPRNTQIDLNFALAKAYDDIGRPESAFRRLLRGNAMQRQQTLYDEPETLGRFRRIAAVFSADLMRRGAGEGHQSQAPIFICGMARSGSTLVEQILASHPSVHATGETPALQQAVAEMWDRSDGSASFPETAATASPAELRRLAQRYLDMLTHGAPSADRITDKALPNFQLAGLIHIALPNARIIHTRRHPLDTCLSAFSKLFTNAQAHTFDLAELGRYYRAYAALMAHWRRALPAGAMLEIDYETLVADFEPQARRLIAYCGLEWTDSCLKFYEAQRPVHTASAVQVRQPLYRGSVGRWRAYQPWLGPLIEALGDCLDSSDASCEAAPVGRLPGSQVRDTVRAKQS